jgi:hypothetical protein
MMWQQEVFFEKSVANRKVEVLKTYDTRLAQEGIFVDGREGSDSALPIP